MLNKERVILMTKMASYEENEGRKDRAVMSYFRGDYGVKVGSVWDDSVWDCIRNVYIL